MVSFFFFSKIFRAKSSSGADFFLTNHKAPHWLLSQHIICFPANPSYLRVLWVPNPFTCTWETRQRNRKIQPSVKAGWESPLQWDPRATLGSPGCCLWAVRRRGGSVAVIPSGRPLAHLSAAAPWELWDAGVLAGRAHPH